MLSTIATIPLHARMISGPGDYLAWQQQICYFLSGRSPILLE